VALYCVTVALASLRWEVRSMHSALVFVSACVLCHKTICFESVNTDEDGQRVREEPAGDHRRPEYYPSGKAHEIGATTIK